MYNVNKSDLMLKVLDEHEAKYRHVNGWQAMRCINRAAHSHNDSSPSASVNIITGKYKCHACGLAGDGFDIMKELTGMNAKEVMQHYGYDPSGERLPEEETWITWR